MLVIGPGPQGILLEHREIEFEDEVNIQDVFRAVGRMQHELVQLLEIMYSANNHRQIENGPA